MDKCEAIYQLHRANPAITQELASILEKTDDAAEVSFLSAIDDLRKSFAHCYKCQGSIGDMLETFTNEVNTKYDSKLFFSTSKVMGDFKLLQSLKDGANEDILKRVGYAAAVESAEANIKIVKTKLFNVETYKLGVVVSHLASLYPSDWEEFTIATHDRDRTKEFINSKETQRLGTVSGAYRNYVDVLHQQASRCEWFSPWVQENDAEETGAFAKARQAVTDARCALVGAKCAKTIFYKANKFSSSTEDKKKKRDLIRSCKDAVSSLDLGSVFPSSVLAKLNSC